MVLALSEASCDDLLRESIESLIKLGEPIDPRKVKLVKCKAQYSS